MMLSFYDYFFSFFHIALILFNLFGWIWKPLRKWHFGILSLTFFSWFILGIWYGWGYCPLTDWHWEILRELGETDLPPSYISYLLQRFLGLSLNPEAVDVITVSTALAAWTASAYVNFFKSAKKN